MDTDSPRREDDLSDVARRLAGWRPAPAGLDADAMLFAAGQAAGRRGRGRLLWPALCAVLAVQAAVLGAWGLSERAERQSLARRLQECPPAPSVSPGSAVVQGPEPSYTPSSEDYFHLLHRIEQDPGRWLASSDTSGSQGAAPPPEGAPVLKAGQPGRLLDQ